MTPPLPPPGTFDWLPPEIGEKEQLEDAYQAITAAGMWEFFRTQEPPPEVGYAWWNAAELKEVQKYMKLFDYHSAASFAYIMRQMQFIAVRGWPAYVAWRGGSGR